MNRKIAAITCFASLAQALFGVENVTVTINTDSSYPLGSFDSMTLTGDLRGCLNYLNTVTDPSKNIIFQSNMSISLSGNLPVLNLVDTSAINFNSSNQIVTLSGNSLYQGIIARQGNITINKTTFQDCWAIAGAGGSGGGGGGMGAGGAVFSDAADITLNNVTIQNCRAVGGSGGTSAAIAKQGGGGGGGMGGAGGGGGAGSSVAYGGGGGGGALGTNALGGVGGNSVGSYSGGGGGGAGINGVGGVGSAAGVLLNGSGGGGGGIYAAGGTGSTLGSGGAGSTQDVYGGGGGGTSDVSSAGGVGGASACTPAAATMLGGSGGGQNLCSGFLTRVGGEGTDITGGGGGGGGGVDNLQSSLDLEGGSGGEGGGGGGAGSCGSSTSCNVAGGAGGWGGGSGGAGGNSTGTSGSLSSGGTGGGGGGGSGAVDGSAGGFGGGGGGGGGINSSIGGVSALGGGSGGAFSDTGYNSTSSGVGGGWGFHGGGGGAAFGGAIFVNSGMLTIVNSNMDGTSRVQAGMGADGGSAGASAGGGICVLNSLGGSTIVFNQLPNTTYTIADDIADGSATSISGQGFTNGIYDPVAVTLNCDNSSGGNVTFSGNNTYSGGTTFARVRVTIPSDSSLGLKTSPLNVAALSSSLIISNDILDMQRPIFVNINSSHIFDFNTNGYNLTYSGTITVSQAASIDKNGLGTLTLTGSSVYSKTTNINAGTLCLDGSLGSPIMVNANAILQGMGAVTNNQLVTVNANGTIRPGNPGQIGSLTINGALALQSDSATYIELIPQAASSITVSGLATLAASSELILQANPGFYPNGSSYTILRASSITGTFDTPTFTPGSQDLGTLTVTYPGSTSVVLTFTNIPRVLIDLNLLGGNINAQHLASYLNQFINDPVLGPVVFDLVNLSPEKLNTALNSISPARNAISTFVAQNTLFSIASTVSNRMAQQRFSMRSAQTARSLVEIDEEEDIFAKPAYGLFHELQKSRFMASAPFDSRKWMREFASAVYWEEEDEYFESFEEEYQSRKNEVPYGSSQTWASVENRWAFWLEALGELTHQQAEHANPAYSASTAGGLLGFDYYGAKEGLVGAALCFAKSSIAQHGHAGKNSLDYYAATVYGTVYMGDGYLEVGLAGAFNDIENKRHVQFPQVSAPQFNETAKSSYWAVQMSPHLGGGYDVNFSWQTLEFFASLDYNLFFLPSFSEVKAAPLNMHQEKSFPQLFRGEAGINLYQLCRTSLGDLIFRETFSYINKKPFKVGYIEANIVGYPSGFTVDSFTQDQNLLSPGFELLYRAEHGSFVSFTYKGEFQLGLSHYISNSVLGKLGAYF